jgi:hypothetical protein
MQYPFLAAALLLMGCVVQYAPQVKPTLTDVIVIASVKCALIDDKTYEATKTLEQIEASYRCARSVTAPAAADPGFQWVAKRMAGWKQRWEQVIAGNLSSAQAQADDATEFWSIDKQIWLAQEERREAQRQHHDEGYIAPLLEQQGQPQAEEARRRELPNPHVQLVIGHAQATCILFGFAEGSPAFRDCFPLTFFEFARRDRAETR